MAIKSYKPTSAGRRHQTCSTFEEITSTTPEKSLLVTLKKTGGRNSFGRITSRHIGGGHKQKYRIIDFRRDKRGIPAKQLFAARMSPAPGASLPRGPPDWYRAPDRRYVSTYQFASVLHQFDPAPMNLDSSYDTCLEVLTDSNARA